jgi:hypothetical protein
MKLLAARALFRIVKRMIFEASIEVRRHPGGCGIRSCGSADACRRIDVIGAETCLHRAFLAPGAPAL